MPENRETIIALRARRQAFQIAMAVLHDGKSPIESVVCKRCGSRFSPTNLNPENRVCGPCLAAQIAIPSKAINEVLEACDLYVKDAASLSLIIQRLWKLTYCGKEPEVRVDFLHQFIKPLENIQYGVGKVDRAVRFAMIDLLRGHLEAMLPTDEKLAVESPSEMHQ